ncbi:MAG: hypothetical protein ACFFCS_09450 [Candidatus Hodarchaeota archaeon]
MISHHFKVVEDGSEETIIVLKGNTLLLSILAIFLAALITFIIILLSTAPMELSHVTNPAIWVLVLFSILEFFLWVMILSKKKITINKVEKHVFVKDNQVLFVNKHGPLPFDSISKVNLRTGRTSLMSRYGQKVVIYMLVIESTGNPPIFLATSTKSERLTELKLILEKQIGLDS